MHKKLGPLEAWQWAAILAGLVLVYYVYEYEKNNSAASTTSSSTDNSGAIDPTTGIPYADEVGSGAGYGYSGGGGGVGDGGVGDTGSTGASTDSGTSLGQELSDLGSIEGLMQNLGIGTTVSSSPAGLTTGQQNTLNSDLTKLNKTLTTETKTLKSQGKTITTLKKQVAKLTPKKTTKPASHKNPGHHVTTHVGGSKIAKSSAPANSQQHKNIQPPSHQRATHRPAPKPKPKPKKKAKA